MSHLTTFMSPCQNTFRIAYFSRTLLIGYRLYVYKNEYRILRFQTFCVDHNISLSSTGG